MFPRRSFAYFFIIFLSVHSGVLPPPPTNTKKLATLLRPGTCSSGSGAACMPENKAQCLPRFLELEILQWGRPRTAIARSRLVHVRLYAFARVYLYAGFFQGGCLNIACHDAATGLKKSRGGWGWGDSDTSFSFLTIFGSIFQTHGSLVYRGILVHHQPLSDKQASKKQKQKKTA